MKLAIRLTGARLTGALVLATVWTIAAARVEAAVFVINNGLAPPNPDNVIDAGNSYPEDAVYVQNVGCDALMQYPCPAPGDPTSVELAEGGSVGLSLAVYESSTVTLSGGSVGSTLVANDSSTVTLSGGSVGSDLAALDSSAVTLSGGSVAGTIFAAASSGVTIVGTDFAVDGVPVGFGPIEAMLGTLTGTLASGEPIDNDFCHDGCQVEVVVFTGLITLPEPDAALLSPLAALGLATLAAARRRRR